MHSSPNRNRARRANYGFPTLPYSTVADEDQAVQSLVVPKPTSSTQETWSRAVLGALYLAVPCLVQLLYAFSSWSAPT